MTAIYAHCDLPTSPKIAALAAIISCDADTAVGKVLKAASFAATAPNNFIKPHHFSLIDQQCGVESFVEKMWQAKIVYYNDIDFVGRIYRFDRKLITFGDSDGR
jgi:hypothetical protein